MGSLDQILRAVALIVTKLKEDDRFEQLSSQTPYFRTSASVPEGEPSNLYLSLHSYIAFLSRSFSIKKKSSTKDRPPSLTPPLPPGPLPP